MFIKILIVTLFGSITGYAQEIEGELNVMKSDSTQVMEVACGQCLFDLPGTGCDLAVRVGGKAYFVTGTHIDAHGDAHANDGFCNAVRTAHVSGELKGDTFHVNSLELIPKKDSGQK